MMYVAPLKFWSLFVREPRVLVLFAGCLHASQRFSFFRPVLDAADNLVSYNKMREENVTVGTVPN
jgi:hypothetical protein